MRRLGSRSLAALVLVPWFLACAGDGSGDGSDEPSPDDLPLGDLGAADSKADGNWGAALTCKTAPALPPLPHPQITVSLDGLTLHLVDRTVGFDKVFPVGVGAHDDDETSMTYGESLSYEPLAASGKQDFTIKPSTITPCKIWWTDPETGEKLPVFAGLPFMSWSGPYAIHGPIDNYRAANGGNLRRGYVSHGCIRMEAADVLEVYARIKGVASVPVHVQREAERTAEGPRVDVPQRWIGAECTRDADCNYAGGVCKANRWSGRGVCTARCTSTCADRAGQPQTFCVADPDAAGQGMCVPKHTAVNAGCRPYDHFVPATRSRPAQASVTAAVCVPGTPGRVGDRCFADGDCTGGTRCSHGVCTIACDRFCADQPGYADTFCVRDDTLGAGGSCARQCTPSSNASECSAGSTCVARGRNGQPSVVRNVCLPR
ncbi:MAG TPA: L,D-transpeptidase [Kofleriaceae bacterium]|nr:L,D-transpeptidase [Kofleriaceae bacterium]